MRMKKGEMKMGKIKVGIIIVILIAMVGGYYFYLSNFRDTDEETVVTEVQDVLLKNLIRIIRRHRGKF